MRRAGLESEEYPSVKASLSSYVEPMSHFLLLLETRGGSISPTPGCWLKLAHGGNYLPVSRVLHTRDAAALPSLPSRLGQIWPSFAASLRFARHKYFSTVPFETCSMAAISSFFITRSP